MNKAIKFGNQTCCIGRVLVTSIFSHPLKGVQDFRGKYDGSRITTSPLAFLLLTRYNTVNRKTKERETMILFYGSKICIDCRNTLAILKARKLEDQFRFIDMTANTDNMKAFLTLRDREAAFAPAREGENGRSFIGIPAFVKEDGKVTLDLDEALDWLGQPPVREEEIVEK